MKRRLRLAIALAACLPQALAPLAAYALAQPGSGPSDLCSVVRKAQVAERIPATLPAAPGDHRLMVRCAYCPGGSAAAALLPAPVAPVFTAIVDAATVPMPTHRLETPAPTLLPPSRGPPATGFPV